MFFTNIITKLFLSAPSPAEFWQRTSQQVFYGGLVGVDVVFSTQTTTPTTTHRTYVFGCSESE